MEKHDSVDEMDRRILQILSVYKQLTLLQLRYELGGDDLPNERVTEEEILKRLESLRERGFVESLTKPEFVNRNSALLIYRLKTSDDALGDRGGGAGNPE